MLAVEDQNGPLRQVAIDRRWFLEKLRPYFVWCVYVEGTFYVSTLELKWEPAVYDDKLSANSINCPLTTQKSS